MSMVRLSPLSDDLDADAFADFRRKHAGQAPVSSYRAVRIIAGILIALVGVALLAPVGDLLDQPGGYILIGFSLLALIAGIGLVFSRSDFWSRWYRLVSFAAENGWKYDRDTGRPLQKPQLPGVHFTITGASSTKTVERLSAPDHAVPFEVGSYEYTYRPDPDLQDLTNVQISYIAIRLERDVPHLYLDARGNHTTPRALNLDKNQTLSLEGDFDAHFTTYCPPKYEQDALYLLTPDLMGLLIDHASAHDIEFIDDWVLFYRMAGEFPETEEEWADTITLVDRVGSRARRRSARYRDGEAGLVDEDDGSPSTIAASGRRLHKDKRVWPNRVGIVIGSGLIVAALLKAMGAFG